MSEILSRNALEQYQLMIQPIAESMQFIKQFHECKRLVTSIHQLDGVLSRYNLINYYPDDLSNEEVIENEEINSKIITEIFGSKEVSDKKDSAIITLSPVNDTVLKYLSENPETFYQLSGREFEVVMAEIYNRLGYNVELTKETRDRGKDIIIRKPEILGDFMYYVECKKYAANHPIGVGIVRAFDGVINMDRVNGGIIATTSYFSKDARDLILDKNLSYQIQMHDYDKIKTLLKRIIQ